MRLKRKLPWPASRIDREQLHLLWRLGQLRRISITKIVAQAVSEYLKQYSNN